MGKKKIFIFVIVIIILIIIGGIAYNFRTLFGISPGVYLTTDGGQTKEETPAEKFQKAVNRLDTPDKLVEFMNENFSLELREGDVAVPPEQLFLEKKGGIQDFAVFSASVLNYHKYETGILYYKFSFGNGTGTDENGTGTNKVVVFREDNLPGYFYFFEGKVSLAQYGSSFMELIGAEEKRLNINITESTVFFPGVLDLTPKEWTQKW